MNVNNFGLNLDRYLEEHKITRTQLAKGIGIDNSHLSKWIYGKKGISLKWYIAVVEWLDIPSNLLLEDTDVKDKQEGNRAEYKENDC